MHICIHTHVHTHNTPPPLLPPPPPPSPYFTRSQKFFAHTFKSAFYRMLLQEVSKLCDALMHSHTLKELSISAHSLDVASAQALAGMLAANNSERVCFSSYLHCKAGYDLPCATYVEIIGFNMRNQHLASIARSLLQTNKDRKFDDGQNAWKYSIQMPASNFLPSHEQSVQLTYPFNSSRYTLEWPTVCARYYGEAVMHQDWVSK
eukprot:scaffold93350_cov17-Tisochrysis_lutea.AAC.1